MKLIKLTQGRFAQVDDADYDYLNQWKWNADESHGNWYARRIDCSTGQRIKLSMHRVILNITDPKIKGDHRDRDTLNNQRYNLREATHSQNAQNKTSAINSTSKYLGVYWKTSDKRWRAEIHINKKNIYLGNYKIEEDAARAYDIKAKEHFGEFANLNFK